jgi:gas vesicle protein
MLFLLIGAAVGAVAGACIAYASDEDDRQSSKHHRQVANQLTTDYSSLQKRYDDSAHKAERQFQEQASLDQREITRLTRLKAQNEEEKDLLRLTVRLQQSLHNLMLDIEKEPSKESLAQFEQAILVTNRVLSKLNEELFQVSDTYFSHNLERVRKIEEQHSAQLIKGSTYPVKQCRKCGKKNRVSLHSSNHSPICGNCKCRLAEEIIKTECTSNDIEPNIVQQDQESIKTPDRDFPGTFATYEAYIAWFRSFSTMPSLSRDLFYRSEMYYRSRSVSQKSYQRTHQGNRKSSTDKIYLY